MTKEQARKLIAKKNPEKWYPIYVSEFIHERYSADAETALINNYLADPEKYRQKYEQYQTYRLECKARAKEICGIG